MDEKKLNLGQNEWRMEGWINIDIDPSTNPDIIADAAHLPYEDNSIDEIYAGHLLEHFDIEQEVLREWHRVLKPGGKITICVPDIEKSLSEWRNGNMLESFLNQVVYGAKNRDAQNHHQIFTKEILQRQMVEYFKDVKEITKCPYWVSDVVWQTTMEGTK